MRVTTTIKISTYSCQAILIVTDQIKLEAEKIYKKYKIKLAEDDGENEGLLISLNIDKYYLLIDFKYLSHNTIAHEIYHAAVRVTEDRGVTDEEAQAWVCGHITGSTYKFLSKKNIPIKHG
jgi:hypothetical protein